MSHLHRVLVLSAIGLVVCSCGSNREGAVEKRGARSGDDPVTRQETPASVAPIVIDTRSPEEYAGGHLEGALLMPHATIGGMIEARVPDKNTPILLYCRSGHRAGIALKTLVSMNYTHVENLGGMLDAAAKLKKETVK